MRVKPSPPCFVAIWVVVLALGPAVLTSAVLGQEEPAVPPGAELDFARATLGLWGTEESAGRIEALCESVAHDPRAARRVLAGLRAEGTARADTLRAELLWHCAQGFRPRRNAPDDWAVMPTEEVGRRAAALLDHEDPAVRAIAEWAIDARLSAECEGNFPRPWPNPARCDWYARWLAVPEEELLELEYMRRAFIFGRHRTGKDLADAARRDMERALRVAERARAAGVPGGEGRVRTMRRALHELEETAGRAPKDLTAIRRQYLAFCRARRRVVMANPDLDVDRLLFAVRNNNDAFNITQGDLLDIFGAEGEIYVKDGLNPEDPVRPLLKGRLGQGHLRGVDLWWDAERILFSFVGQPRWQEILQEGAQRARSMVKDGVQRRIFNGIRGLNDAKGTRADRAHLYELNLSTGELRRLTDAPHNDDYEPAYLPNGDIVFCSDRSNYGSQCAGGPGQDKMIINLYRASADGTGVHPLSNNKDFDRYPRIMDDGRVMFLHWEYQERHLYLPHTLWSSRPDGMGTDALYKQHIPHTPMSLREARQVPGTSKIAAIACGHHCGAIGSLFLVDYSRGINEGDGMRVVTPDVSPTEWNYGSWPTVRQGGVEDRGGYYHSPYPLSDKSFLVAYSYNHSCHVWARSYGLYYVDVWGNKELVHRDRKMSITSPMPLRPRARPRVIPDAVVEGSKEAYVCVNDVHEGLEGVEHGTVKYIRVAQHMPWPCVRDTTQDNGIAFDDIHYAPSGPWGRVLGFNGWSPARSIGVVPVEEDGSAYFRVPVRQPVYFQALDENFMEVRRMRSFVTFQPGERRGCIGCHETRPVASRELENPMPLAIHREASGPDPPPWGAAVVPDFERHMQPILDANCVKCHGRQEPAGGIELTGRKIGGYNQSYRSMFGLKPDQPTPAQSFYIRMWARDDPEWSSEGERDWFSKYFNNDLPGQLVAISNYKSGPEVTEPYQFGSHRSRLITALLEKPVHREKVRLSEDDWRALVTWVDLNAFYHATYTCFTTSERVPVRFPDPWERAPAGLWLLQMIGGQRTVVLKP